MKAPEEWTTASKQDAEEGESVTPPYRMEVPDRTMSEHGAWGTIQPEQEGPVFDNSPDIEIKGERTRRARYDQAERQEREAGS